MAVLITGGTGLIGSFVTRSLLERGEHPAILDVREPGSLLRDAIGNFSFIKGEVTDGDLLVRVIRTYEVDRVIHLAALLQFDCERDPKRAIEVNVEGTLKMLEAAVPAGVKKIVFASSIGVYGPQTGDIREETFISPEFSLYGATKLLGEHLLERYRRISGIPFIALRYCGVYGPGEVRSLGMAEVIKRLESTISGRDATIEALSGDERINFTFVGDAAQATLEALFVERNIHNVFNISGGDDNYITSKKFHAIIKGQVPSAGSAIFTGKKRDQQRVDISLARKELGYSPEYSIERGIGEIVEYFRSRKA
jgi:UDP-glucose 4-epimerase